MIKKKFFKKKHDRHCTYFEYKPKRYKTLAAAKKEGDRLAAELGKCMIYLKRPDGQFTFAPTSGDVRSAMRRVALCFGGDFVDETVVLSLSN